MHLTDHDLRQLDHDPLSRHGEGALRRLAERLLADVKDARDRLNQDSCNSSRLPGSDSVYRQPRGGSDRDPPTHTAPDEPPTVAVGKAEETAEASDDGAPAANEPSGSAALRRLARGGGRVDSCSWQNDRLIPDFLASPIPPSISPSRCRDGGP